MLSTSSFHIHFPRFAIAVSQDICTGTQTIDLTRRYTRQHFLAIQGIYIHHFIIWECQLFDANNTVVLVLEHE